MKRILAVLLVLSLALGLCACAKVDENLLKASEHMETFNSLSYQIDIDVDSIQDGKSVPFSLSARSKIMKKEGLMHMDIDMTADNTHVGYQLYKVQEGFESTEYKGTDLGRGTEWIKDKNSGLKLVSPVPSEEILRFISEVTPAEETAVIGGYEAQKYTGVIKGPSLSLLLKMLTFLGEAGQELSQLLGEGLQHIRVPVTIYLNPEENLILQISLDSMELLKAAGTLDNTDLQCSKFLFSISYGDFDAISSITIPEEALNAPVKASD